MIDLRHATGHGVRVAILDSGVHAAHPHVGWALRGFSMTVENGRVKRSDDSNDVNGHGTACAGVIRWGASDAAIVPVRVLDASLAGHSEAIAAALRELVPDPPHVVNFSLGVHATSDELESAWATLHARGTIGVAAVRADRAHTWPVGADGVVAVAADGTLGSWAYHVDRSGNVPHVSASPFPRPIPGRPPDQNMTGTSFAAPRVSALAARAAEVRGVLSRDQLLEILDANAPNFGGSR